MWEINGKRTANEVEVMKEFGLKFNPIVKSLEDTDLYKFSMGQCYHHQFADLTTTWDFRARNVGEGQALKEPYNSIDIEEIKSQLKAYSALRFEKDELEYLSTKCPWIKKDYINFLSLWHPRFEDFEIEEGGATGIKISFSGVQEYIEYYEIPVLEICAEVYYRNHFDYDLLFKEFKEKTEEKISQMKKGNQWFGTWSEFGARRRLSYEAQDWLIERLAKEKKYTGPFYRFVGTSNVYLAKKYDLTPVGTQAHEFFQCMQGLRQYNPAYSNKIALDAWVKEYGVWNGIALTDTIGTDIFLYDFGKTYATLFSGVRHDSGDPFKWADKMIEHYRRVGVNPMQKTLLFSDGISSLELWNKLALYVKDKAKPAFGIGTFWSGPQTIEPLNIVAKLVLVNGQDVAKLSNTPGKCMCRNSEYVEYLQRCIDWRLTHEKNTNYYID